MTAIITAKNVFKSYGEQHVLKGIDLQLDQGDYVSIMGRSGCGKTTLLKILGMVNSPTSGKVFFEGKDTQELYPDELSDIRRRKLGFVFQDFQLMESITVRENILLPAILDKRNLNEIEQQLKPLIDTLRIDSLLDKLPQTLSVGEKQRTAICRALVNQPRIILADEPTGNLDSNAGAEVLAIFKRINEAMGVTILMITHDNKVANGAKSVIFLKDGKIYDRMKTAGKTTEWEIAEKMVEV
ncbi:ABC transporter ATP-binding protein [Candidatus Enterococcus ferrettii]|uniref:ABC transporter domain-containing protein n=1 Tax=Candidatus Enterococcus ferrettii TaxID=2815324 RepID=A0ABV0ES22_9ENTE|nr:ABC transporter ATP-binding protein [Enterococcus sp. 665A]MBO1340374.1 ABC transporter ATP-binding protein [Enterococcus sp. 665A]